jgi:hypothetical protein
MQFAEIFCCEQEVNVITQYWIMAHRRKEKKREENVWMMVITWTNWNLIRELLGTSWP